MVRLGVVGYGGRVSGVVKLLQRLDPEVALAAITDIKADEIRSRMGDAAKGVEFFREPEKMLESCKLDGLLIGTRCSLHSTMACRLAGSGLPLFLEKPVSTNMKDLAALRKAYKGRGDRVVVSFPLRLTQHVKVAKEIIDSGRLGRVEHVQAVNNVPYGETYFLNWYRDNAETGGLWLQKATHDIDYVNAIVGMRPVRIAAMQSQRVYGPKGVHGPMPKNLACNDCPKQQECPESPYNLFYMRGVTDKVEPNSHHCAFAPDALNEDNGSCLIEYESGMHVAYTQNFFARRDAASRGATLIGYSGTVSFDWYTDKVRFVAHHRSHTEVIDLSSKHGHGGGDVELARSFLALIRDGKPSESPLEAGILSAFMCMKAKESAESRRFLEIDLGELDRK